MHTEQLTLLVYLKKVIVLVIHPYMFMILMFIWVMMVIISRSEVVRATAKSVIKVFKAVLPQYVIVQSRTFPSGHGNMRHRPTSADFIRGAVP